MRIVLVLILILLCGHAFAGTDSLKNYSYGVNYLGGKIYLHTPKIYVAAPPYSQALEFNFNKQTLGNAYWQQRFGFPETGLSVCVAHYGSPLIGWAAGLYPTIQFRIINFGKGYWYWKLGGGIGIASKSWKRTPPEDSINNIIGSTVNNFTMIQTGIRYQIATNWTIQAGLHFFHVSNAGMRKPNFGINTTGGFVGVNYHPKGFVNHFEKADQRPYKNPLNFGIQAACSFAEAKIANGPMYPTYGLSAFAAKMYRGKSRFALGVDLTYVSRLYAHYKTNFQYPGSERAHAWIGSVFMANEFVFGKIGLPLQLGYYLNRPAGGYPIYEKLGINWHFYRHPDKRIKDLYLSTQLKTHYATADYAEFGVGLLF